MTRVEPVEPRTGCARYRARGHGGPCQRAGREAGWDRGGPPFVPDEGGFVVDGAIGWITGRRGAGMTGMGHAAAGVVAAYLIQRAAHQPFHLGIAGLSALISWLPDIDLVWGWWRRRRLGGQGHNPHHVLWTHTPVFWFLWGGAWPGGWGSLRLWCGGWRCSIWRWTAWGPMMGSCGSGRGGGASMRSSPGRSIGRGRGGRPSRRPSTGSTIGSLSSWRWKCC